MVASSGLRCTRQSQRALRDDSHARRTPSPTPGRALAGAAARRARRARSCRATGGPLGGGGDVPAMQNLLAHVTALEEHDIVGTTPLIFAARYGRLALVKFLLQRGANVNAQTYSGAHALSEAVRRGSLPVVEALLEAGADVQLRDDHRHTALYIAVGYRDLAIIDALLAHGSDIAAMDEEGDTPLTRAADLGLAAIVTTLLASYHAATPIAHIDDALCAAERHGYVDVAELLKARVS